MLITFSAKAYANISMYATDAFNLLGKMGQSTGVPGSILAPDVPAALSRLKAAIEAESQPQATEPHPDDDSFVDVKTRAAPLIALLAAAAKAHCNVMWSEASILD
ncbi:MAG: DUF1840 domain-containing protein [Halothiobacillus sp.]